jgi:hypothetical protein
LKLISLLLFALSPGLAALAIGEATLKIGRLQRIEWKLVTNLPAKSLNSALEKICWYAMRWKIETFHKILKPGCHAEQSKLCTTERLSKLIAVFCIL